MDNILVDEILLEVIKGSFGGHRLYSASFVQHGKFIYFYRQSSKSQILELIEYDLQNFKSRTMEGYDLSCSTLSNVCFSE